MPTISMFYGILVRMFFRDAEKHHTPHLHADYQGTVAIYSILDGAVLSGQLPPNKHKLVAAWRDPPRGFACGLGTGGQWQKTVPHQRT